MVVMETLNKSNRQIDTMMEEDQQSKTLEGDVSMTCTGQSYDKVRVQNESLANPKVTRRIGTWNVRSMYATGKTAQVLREMRRYHLDILGISECRSTGSGKIRTRAGETIIYSGRTDDHHSNGVAISMSKATAMSLNELTPVSDGIISARFWSRPQ